MTTAEVVQLDTARALRLGGSECAAAAGVDPYRSRVMLWAEKTGRVTRPESDAMMWGKRLEPVVWAALLDEGYNLFRGPDSEYVDAARSWVRGTPDGFAGDGEGRLLLELKTSGHWGAHAWDNDGIPAATICQCQWYLHLTGLDRALIAVLIEGQRLETRTLDRDERLIELLLETGEDFMEHVRADRMPAPDGSTSARDALRAIFPEANGLTVRFDRKQTRRVRDLQRRKEQLAVVKAQVAELEQLVQADMGEAEVAIGPNDERLATWRNQSRRAVNVTELRKQRPELADLFTTETTTRRFSLA